jgi:hypothetical protein
VHVGAVSVAFQRHSRPCLVGVFLMWHTQLVVADNLVVRDLLPLAGALEVLRHQPLVPQHLGVRDHGDKVVRRHGFPDLVQEGSVVDAEGRRNACSQTGPVLPKSTCQPNTLPPLSQSLGGRGPQVRRGIFH